MRLTALRRSGSAMERARLALGEEEEEKGRGGIKRTAL
jgi:hypothetical protein